MFFSFSLIPTLGKFAPFRIGSGETDGRSFVNSRTLALEGQIDRALHDDGIDRVSHAS